MQSVNEIDLIDDLDEDIPFDVLQNAQLAQLSPVQKQ